MDIGERTGSMARPADGLKVITANRLDSGAVVWLAPDRSWVHRIALAAILEGSETETALARVQGEAVAAGLVEPYLIDVVVIGGVPRPVRPREQIRALGPSVRTDLGVQAGQQQ